MMRQLVRICESGGRVLDPFAGSGTTLVAAQLEGFEAVGIEMTDQYTTVTRDRLTAL
ncbi:Site-specific DNA-methyltransferase (fragment) [Xanthomonas citri pv. citri]